MMRFLKNEKGQGLAEFGLILTVIAIAAVLTLNLFSAGVSGLFSDTAGIMDSSKENTVYLITTEDGIYVLNATGQLKGPYTGSATDIMIPYSVSGYTVKQIQQDVFNGKNLTSVIFTDDNQITRIHARAFNDNQLTSISLPANLQRIDLWAFRNNKLTEVTLPSNMQTIEQKAFSGNNITKITIGSNVSSIGTAVFDNDNEGFKAAYAAGGAGTYVYTGGKWVKE